MQGTMQDYPLTLVHFFDRVDDLFFDKGVATATPGGVERVSYRDWAARTRRLGGVLDALGVSPQGRVGTFAWNTARHLELYFAAPCTGRVLHTLNIRLFPDQLTYIVNHAEDEVIFVDRSLAALLFPLVSSFGTVKHLVVMDDGQGDIPSLDNGPEIHDYEELLAGAGAGRLPRRRRTSGRGHVLHERHHRQPQGRRLHPPLDLPAHAGRHGGRQHRHPRERLGAAGRADVPRQRLGSGPRRRGRRGQPGDARRQPDPCRPSPT